MAPQLCAEDGGVVRHAVSFPELKQQYVHVRAEWPVSGEAVDVRMATWTPGSYLVREFSANVDRIAFHGADGRLLKHAKVSKDTWRVETGGSPLLVAEYDVHAGDLGVQTSWAGEDFILINGASIFLFTGETREFQQEVTLAAPEGMGRALAALPREGDAFRALGFDELVDSPIVVTDAVAHRFSDRGHDFLLVNVPASESWDGPQSARDVHAIVEAANELWGAVPFEREYWFFNFPVEHRGGLEHDHSTVMMTGRWQMRDREDYIKWLGLVAHEYFHAWNVRRMRPEALARYDYGREQYSGSLWLAEGITSYYDNLLLSRARLVSPNEYFKRLATDLHALEMTPGRSRISLREASREAWIRSYRPDANTLNSTVSYYTKGAVLGFVLDTRLRSESEGEAGLDDVIRLMWERWGDTPYPERAFADAVEEIGGEQTRAWLEPLLETPAEPDVDAALAWYGLALDRHPVNNAARKAGEPLETGFGVNWSAETDALVIENVLHGMTGSKAGLLPGDELLAINGERVIRDTLDGRLKAIGPGEKVELLVDRRGKIITVPVMLEEARPETFEVGPGEVFGDRELSRLESWLGQPLQMTDE